MMIGWMHKMREATVILLQFVAVCSLLSMVCATTPELPAGETIGQWVWFGKAVLVSTGCITASCLLQLLGKTSWTDILCFRNFFVHVAWSLVLLGAIEAVWGLRLALRLKEEGKIRHIGLSSHNPTVARLAVESGLIEVLMFSINPCYDLQPPSENVDDLWADESYAHSLENIDPEREKLYELCEQKGIGLDVMKAYGGGDLLSETNSPFGKAMTPVQCIEYALTRPAVASVMVGCKSCDEMQAAINWCNATKEEKDYTPIMAGMEKFSWQGHCMYCGHCAPCSVGIDIASVNKYYNLTIAQNEIPETVREHYKTLSHHASECIQCGQCETNCPFGVAIIEQMEKAAEKFGY